VEVRLLTVPSGMAGDSAIWDCERPQVFTQGAKAELARLSASVE
jgi:hypothetical protein